MRQCFLVSEVKDEGGGKDEKAECGRFVSGSYSR